MFVGFSVKKRKAVCFRNKVKIYNREKKEKSYFRETMWEHINERMIRSAKTAFNIPLLKVSK